MISAMGPLTILSTGGMGQAEQQLGVTFDPTKAIIVGAIGWTNGPQSQAVACATATSQASGDSGPSGTTIYTDGQGNPAAGLSGTNGNNGQFLIVNADPGSPATITAQAGGYTASTTVPYLFADGVTFVTEMFSTPPTPGNPTPANCAYGDDDDDTTPPDDDDDTTPGDDDSADDDTALLDDDSSLVDDDSSLVDDDSSLVDDDSSLVDDDSSLVDDDSSPTDDDTSPADDDNETSPPSVRMVSWGVGGAPNYCPGPINASPGWPGWGLSIETSMLSGSAVGGAVNPPGVSPSTTFFSLVQPTTPIVNSCGCATPPQLLDIQHNYQHDANFQAVALSLEIYLSGNTADLWKWNGTPANGIPSKHGQVALQFDPPTDPLPAGDLWLTANLGTDLAADSPIFGLVNYPNLGSVIDLWSLSWWVTNVDSPRILADDCGYPATDTLVGDDNTPYYLYQPATSLWSSMEFITVASTGPGGWAETPYKQYSLAFSAAVEADDHWSGFSSDAELLFQWVPNYTVWGDYAGDLDVPLCPYAKFNNLGELVGDGLENWIAAGSLAPDNGCMICCPWWYADDSACSTIHSYKDEQIPMVDTSFVDPAFYPMGIDSGWRLNATDDTCHVVAGLAYSVAN